MLSFKLFLEDTSQKYDYVELDSVMEYVEDVLIPETFLAEALDRKVKPRTAQPWDNSSGKNRSDVKTMYCLLYTSPSPRDGLLSRMPSSA